MDAVLIRIFPVGWDTDILLGCMKDLRMKFLDVRTIIFDKRLLRVVALVENFYVTKGLLHQRMPAREVELELISAPNCGQWASQLRELWAEREAELAQGAGI